MILISFIYYIMVQNSHLQKPLTKKVYEQIVKQYKIYKKFNIKNVEKDSKKTKM